MPAVVVFAVGCFFPNLPSRKQITTTRIHPCCLFEGLIFSSWLGAVLRHLQLKGRLKAVVPSALA